MTTQCEGAGQIIAAIDVHGAGAANPLAAGAAEGERRVDVALDLDEGVENHRPALIQIHMIAVDARVIVIVRAPAIDTELAPLAFAKGLVPRLALRDFRIFRESEFDHVFTSLFRRPLNPDAFNMPQQLNSGVRRNDGRWITIKLHCRWSHNIHRLAGVSSLTPLCRTPLAHSP